MGGNGCFVCIRDEVMMYTGVHYIGAVSAAWDIVIRTALLKFSVMSCCRLHSYVKYVECVKHYDGSGNPVFSAEIPRVLMIPSRSKRGRILSESTTTTQFVLDLEVDDAFGDTLCFPVSVYARPR